MKYRLKVNRVVYGAARVVVVGIFFSGRCLQKVPENLAKLENCGLRNDVLLILSQTTELVLRSGTASAASFSLMWPAE